MEGSHREECQCYARRVDPLCVEHRDALAEAVAAFAATEVDAVERARDEALKSGLQATLEAEGQQARAETAERERDEARREVATWKMQAYDHGYQP